MGRWVLALLVAFPLLADVEWAIDWEDALEESRETGRPILVMLSMEGCHYCRRMKEKVFADSRVENFLNERVVAVEIDVRRDEIPDGLTPYGTPTFYLVVDGGTKMSRPVVGAAGADAFLERMEKVIKRVTPLRP